MAVFRIFSTNPIPNIVKTNRLFYCTSFSKHLEYQQCYRILGVPIDSNPEQIRDAYLKLVKLYHPDSGSEYANDEQFTKIDKAFKTLMSWKSKEQSPTINDETVVQYDIKHTAPQHRQYLSYAGLGSGTPMEREKQYTKYRAIQAADNVLKHRINKVIAEDGTLMLKESKKPIQHDIKTQYGFERLVEDLIQESMSKGEFNNLQGSGKPLHDQYNRNPFVDLTTHKINEVLIDNGFTPEWITLQKEIKEEIQQLRDDLSDERKRFSTYPLKDEEYDYWLENVQEFVKSVEEINRKIDKFNLVVPLLDKQMLHVDLFKEADKILINGVPSNSIVIKFEENVLHEADDFISAIIKKISLYLK